MKGLLRKDLYVLRSIGLMFILMDLVFSVIPDLRFFAFAAFYTVMLSLILMQTDEQSKWDTLLPMLPVSRKRVVLEMYLFDWCYIAAIALLAVGSQFLIWSHVGYMAVDREYFTVFLFDVSLALIIQGVTLPVLFRFGTQKGRIMLLVAIGIVTALTVGILSDGIEVVINILSWVRGWHLLLAGVVIDAASLPLSVAGYNKRIHA